MLNKSNGDYIELISKYKGDKYYHLSKGIQLLFVLKGRIEVDGGYKEYIVEKNNSIILEKNEIIQLKFIEKSDFIIINVDRCIKHNNNNDLKNIYLLSKLKFVDDVINFDLELINLIERIISNYKCNSEIREFKLVSLQYELIYYLINQYTKSRNKEKDFSINDVNFERLKRVNKYIEENYSNNVTLEDVASSEYLSVQYFAKFFKGATGSTFFTYLNDYRLDIAINEIINTNISILDIAMKTGFTNVRSFIEIFKKKYGQTPSQYRKNIGIEDIIGSHLLLNKVEYEKISEIIKSNISDYKLQNINLGTSKELKVNMIKEQLQLRHTWKNIVTVGRARLLLVEDIRKQLQEIQKEVGFKYIRFHGIFNDDMFLYDEDKDGNVLLNFNYVNEVLDFIYSIGIKPFVEIGFMPKKLAFNKNYAILNNNFIVSKPKDIEKWNYLVREFVKHCINRYGLDEVNSWYFEFWNEPNLCEVNKNNNDDSLVLELIKNNKFWIGSLDEYFELYKNTYKTIKNIDENIKIGGPSIEASALLIGNWFNEYIEYIKKNECIMDFISLHVYPEVALVEERGYNNHSYLRKMENYLSNIINNIKVILKNNDIDKEIHVTEWNFLVKSAENNITDGCYKACYIVKNIVRSLDLVESLGYWTFTDYIETIKGQNNLIFNNGLGLMTSNGIKKASYNAYVLLGKLGNILISKDEDYIITRNGRNYQILLFNAVDNIYDNKESIYYNMVLNNVNKGIYEEKIYFLNEESGSSYDVWIRMGCNNSLTDEDVRYLKSKTIMEYKKKVIEVSANIKKNICLKKNEIILIEYIYKY